MSLYKRYQTDVNAEEQGITLEFGDNVKVVVRSTDSNTVRALESKWMKRNRQAIMANNGILPPELQDDKEIFLASEGVILNWSNVTGPDGKELPYSKANAKKVMTDLREFRRELMYLAGLAETFRRQEMEEAAGNSAAPSTPTSA